MNPAVEHLELKLSQALRRLGVESCDQLAIGFFNEWNDQNIATAQTLEPEEWDNIAKKFIHEP